jgi:glycosyltransferase involved in cell wall biosynthesis
MGHKVTVVASPVNYSTGRPSSYISDGQVDDKKRLRIICAPTLNTLSKSFILRTIAYLAFMVTSTIVALRVPNVDLVMGTSPPIFQALSAYVVSRLRRRPLLIEIRDLWPDFAIDIGVLRNPILIFASRAVERFLYRHADHLLVNSPAYVGHITSKKIVLEKVSLIPNGVNPDMFHPDHSGLDFRASLGIGNKFVVTYAGALGLANDIPTILQAAERLGADPSIMFVIVGDGKDRPQLESIVARKGLTNVIFAGPVPKSQLAQALAASDVCVATLKNIPMFRMTYPNKVFDYMAAGRPVVLAIDGVIRDVVEGTGAGVFVEPGNPTSIADAVRKLKEDPELRLRMGRSGRECTEQKFNRRDHAAQFCTLVERLAGVAGE